MLAHYMDSHKCEDTQVHGVNADTRLLCHTRVTDDILEVEEDDARTGTC